MISSGSRTRIDIPFKEDDLGILDSIRAAPDSPQARKYTREEDYTLYRYWGIKTTRIFEKEYKRTHTYLRARYNELNGEKMKTYVDSLLKEFESDKEKT